VQSDEELMAAYIAGDRAAFDQLFERYAPRLLRVLARQLASADEADDLLQQTFLQLHRSRHDFRPGAEVRPWLYTIALNLKREYFRRRKRRPQSELRLDGYRDPQVAPHGAERVDAARALQRAFADLSPDQREVIELHWFEGFGFPEIAELVGANLNTVKVRAHRGYQVLRRVLGESGTAAGAGPQLHAERNPEAAPGIPTKSGAR
jgi:RNA polymerase sigma-70 factor (ECF subfamily)